MNKIWQEQNLAVVDHHQLDGHSSWFEQTTVVDGRGLPLVVYRGQHGAAEDGSVQSLLASVTFCGDPSLAGDYAQRPNNRHVQPQAPFDIPAFLHISNPLFEQEDDPFVEASHLIAKLGAALTNMFFRKHADHIQYTSIGKRISRLCLLPDRSAWTKLRHTPTKQNSRINLGFQDDHQ